MLRTLPLALLLIAGCGPREPATFPVEGVAELKGKPAVGFNVEFSSQEEATKGLNAFGQVQDDGTFKVKTMVNGKEKDGAVAGMHKVVVIPPPSGRGPAKIEPVAMRYMDYGTSGLTFEVKPGQANSYRIPLEPEPR